MSENDGKGQDHTCTGYWCALESCRFARATYPLSGEYALQRAAAAEVQCSLDTPEQLVSLALPAANQPASDQSTGTGTRKTGSES